MMYRTLIAAGLSLLPLAGWAQNVVQPVLNEVIYQTRAEQWVTTHTAEVTVSVYATLHENQLATAHADILQKLNKLANAPWHITQFSRTPNDSGLEQVMVQAQTRLAEKALGDLRAQTKKISQPGETFTLQSVVFDPTLAEMEAARTQVRQQIYQQVQTELKELNKMYPDQHYLVHNLRFSENDELPRPQPMLRAAMVATDNAAAPPITVSNKIVLYATVDLVSINRG